MALCDWQLQSKVDPADQRVRGMSAAAGGRGPGPCILTLSGELNDMGLAAM